eukprot:scaffold6603_cov27-Tisochrysis_lutea.AAC.1
MDGGGFLVGLGSSVIGRIGSFVASSVESVWLSSIIACTECLWLEGRLVLTSGRRSRTWRSMSSPGDRVEGRLRLM